MEAGQYTSFYVNRKSQLFPLIEKHANIKIKKGVTHGQLIPLYHRLINNDVSFRAEVDRMIAENPFRNAGGFLATLTGTVGSIFGSIAAKREAELESDKFFYQTILNEQKTSDTTKVLVVSGIALVFVGIAVFLVIKAKK